MTLQENFKYFTQELIHSKQSSLSNLGFERKIKNDNYLECYAPSKGWPTMFKNSKAIGPDQEQIKKYWGLLCREYFLEQYRATNLKKGVNLEFGLELKNYFGFLNDLYLNKNKSGVQISTQQTREKHIQNNTLILTRHVLLYLFLLHQTNILKINILPDTHGSDILRSIAEGLKKLRCNELYKTIQEVLAKKINDFSMQNQIFNDLKKNKEFDSFSQLYSKIDEKKNFIYVLKTRESQPEVQEPSHFSSTTFVHEIKKEEIKDQEKLPVKDFPSEEISVSLDELFKQNIEKNIAQTSSPASSTISDLSINTVSEKSPAVNIHQQRLAKAQSLQEKLKAAQALIPKSSHDGVQNQKIIKPQARVTFQAPDNTSEKKQEKQNKEESEDKNQSLNIPRTRKYFKPEPQKNDISGDCCLPGCSIS